MSTAINTDPSRAISISDEEPRLPLEIEYEIFVLAFYNDTKRQTTLLRVAKRVSEWLIPLLYNVITVYPRSPEYRHPPPTALRRYGHHTHHICFRASDSSSFLPLCPNAYNVAFWFHSTPSPGVFNLPVTRLTFDDFGFLMDELDSDPENTQLTKWCSNITHLTVAEAFTKTERKYLVHFSALEYLMILEWYDNGSLGETIKHLPRLKVAVRLLGSVSDNEKTQVVGYSKLDEEYQDIRIIRMDALFMADWVRGAQGLGDVFDMAEREVEARKQASVKGLP
ncbi:hypothetical protein BDN72DRAFT_840344 [Pluteus cervinus]|uniref:Uncharacterized protein n=1 Tax=Pluteus cervinus TaxID=181527 RepID=A0ACD3AUW9_9AGAR|nr:hypothetical protein BDN72DRAFT_840344 [Pluteus cervinus]